MTLLRPPARIASAASALMLVFVLPGASLVRADGYSPGRPSAASPGATARQDSPRDSDASSPRAHHGDMDMQRAIREARDAVLPALVHVEPIIETYRRGQKAKQAVTGSGVIVDREGHVLTNDHVVAHASRVTCILYDRREVQATVVGRDSISDVAVLLLDLGGQHVPVAKLGSSADLEAGQTVIAMGSPLGLARSLSVGVVSTPERYFPEDFLPDGEITGTYNTWIQTDAAINPGNSGGPLVDLHGRVVGINARAVPIFGENLGFAIPIDVVKDVAAQLMQHGQVRRSWIGVRWQHLKSLAGYFGTAGRGGVLVGAITPGSPAEAAGLQAGDVVLSWNGAPVSVRFEEELPGFRKRIADLPTGTPVKVDLLRQGGAEMSLVVTTAEHPVVETEELEIEGWGLTARDVTPEVARRQRLRSTVGAFVTGVKSAAPAAVAGLEGGDIIRFVEGQPVANAEDLARIAAASADARKRRLLVKADRGATLRLAVIELSP